VEVLIKYCAHNDVCIDSNAVWPQQFVHVQAALAPVLIIILIVVRLIASPSCPLTPSQHFAPVGALPEAEQRAASLDKGARGRDFGVAEWRAHGAANHDKVVSAQRAGRQRLLAARACAGSRKGSGRRGSKVEWDLVSTFLFQLASRGLVKNALLITKPRQYRCLN
jgi:hypothetical protein